MSNGAEHVHSPQEADSKRVDVASGEAGTAPVSAGARKKLVLIDAFSLFYRAFHALPELKTKDETPTQAVYGFALMLIRLLEEERPDLIAVVTDRPGVTFREELYAEYKAQRPQMPDDLARQIPLLYEFIEAFNIPVLGREGYEADDCLGTVARLARQQGLHTLIVTGDKDSLQLVTDGVEVVLTRRGIKDTERLDVAGVKEKLGVVPARVADLKGLTGDPSDNIPGVPGVGPKTAVKWLDRYGDLETLLAHAEEIKGKVGENLRRHLDQARLSKRLATIDTNVPLTVEWDALRREDPSWDELFSFLRRCEFGSLFRRLQAQAPPTHRSLDDNSESVDGGDDAHAKTGHPGNENRGDTPLLSPAAMADWLEKLAETDSLTAVLVSVGEHPLEAMPVALAVACAGESGVMSVEKSHERGVNEQVRAVLKRVFSHPDVEKVVFDAKALIHALRPWGVQLAPPFHDAMLAAYLLNPGQGTPQASALVAETMGEEVAHPHEVVFGQPAGKKGRATGRSGARKEIGRSWQDNLRAGAGDLASFADALRRAWPTLWEQMREAGLLALYEEIEIPLIAVLAEMEHAGIRVDRRYLQTMSAEMDARLDEMTKRVHALAGEEFNLNSPRQLGKILYDKLGLPVLKKTKTGPSTDAEVLEKLAEQHELPAALLEYRQVAKLKSTYVDALPALTDSTTGRVHTHFNQAVAATGRLSSTQPNLQNIPVRTEEGRLIRAAFIPESEDDVLLAADYSQIELRILAHLSGDDAFLEAFRQGEDIHIRTAAEVFEIPLAEVTPQQRAAAKAINFGIVYGISSFGLARGTGLSLQEAQHYIEGYFDRYPGVKNYLEDTVAAAKETGYVVTLFGRRRYLPDLTSRNRARRQFAERTAMNTPIQGSAADIIKRSMVKLSRTLRELDLGARLLLQVHDELVLECPRNHVQAVGRAVKEAMEGAADLDVPLVVELKVGRNWRETEPLTLDAR